MKLPKTKARTQGVAPFAYDSDVENKIFVRNEAKYKIRCEKARGQTHTQKNQNTVTLSCDCEVITSMA